MPCSKSGAQRASRHRSTILAMVLAAAALFAANPLSASAVSAPWIDTERWVLYLTNCMRTGGWVRADGTCKGYGSGNFSGYRRPLGRHIGISNLVSRPWAKTLAVRAACRHGDPGARLRRAGFYGWTWGENIGCRDGYASARTAVLQSLRYFQAEKSTGGGHWRNIKNSNFRCVGIGIWRYNGRTRLVQDFYGSC